MVGRKSKIDTYKLSPLIDKYLAKGMSYQQICDRINREYPEVDLRINDISRHLRGYTKSTRQNLNLELMEYVSTLQTELLCELDRCNIGSGDKKALKRRVFTIWNRLEGRLKTAYGLDITTENSLQELGELLILEFSKALCHHCRGRVVEILDNQGIVSDNNSEEN